MAQAGLELAISLSQVPTVLGFQARATTPNCTHFSPASLFSQHPRQQTLRLRMRACSSSPLHQASKTATETPTLHRTELFALLPPWLWTGLGALVLLAPKPVLSLLLGCASHPLALYVSAFGSLLFIFFLWQSILFHAILV